MGCRNRGISDEESAVSASLSDALLFTTMCIIGLPVDVHVKDGSIYSGIFHTACIENDYAIVLKRARMTKKGNLDANVANGGTIETLIVLSEDLVQVVAKGVVLPADGVAVNVAGEDIGAVAATNYSPEYTEREAKTTKLSKSNMNRRQISQIRCSTQIENGFAHGFSPKTASYLGNSLEIEKVKSDGIDLAETEEASSVPFNGRQVGDGWSQGKQGDYKEKPEFQKEQTEVQGSTSSSDGCDTQLDAVENIHGKITSKVLPNGVSDESSGTFIVKIDDQCHEKHILEDIPCSDAVSTAVASVVDVSSESFLSSSSTTSEKAPPKSSSSNKSAKEFKLNPGAKIFSPSFAHHRPATPPAVPAVASLAYIPDNCPAVSVAPAQPEIEISPFAPRSSLPVKFVPYGNLVAGNGGSEAQYSQPIVGHVGSRTQPVRYAGQYHPVQAGPAYVHPNSQNVMVGRLGPLVYMHPVSHDVVQGTTLSQVSTRPLLTSHQFHLPKHQGSAAAQALQLCVSPPFIASGQQSFTVPGHIPISQPLFPVFRPIPGSNGYLGSKFS